MSWSQLRPRGPTFQGLASTPVPSGERDPLVAGGGKGLLHDDGALQPLRWLTTR